METAYETWVVPLILGTSSCQQAASTAGQVFNK